VTTDPQSFDGLAEHYDRLAELGPGDVARWLRTALPSHGGSAVDIGCGSGRHTVVLAERFDRVVGIDLSEPMVELARRKRPDPKVTYEVRDLMDVGGQQFDLVLSVGALHHMPDLEAALAKIASLVSPGGTAVLVDLVADRDRVPRWWFRAGAVVQLLRDLAGRKAFAFERYRLATHHGWLDHLASDRYLSTAEFDRRYAAVLTGAEMHRVGQFRACVWTRGANVESNDD